jgi:hypothetical protein
MTKNSSPAIRWALVFILAAITFFGYTYHKKSVETLEGRASTWTRLLTALSDTNTGVVEVLSGDTRVTWASSEAMSIFGYEDTMKGLDLTEIMPGYMITKDHNAKVLKAMDNAKVGHLERRVTAITCVGKRKNGEEVRLVIRIFIGRKSVIALLNRAEETRYLPLVPLEVPEPFPDK